MRRAAALLAPLLALLLTAPACRSVPPAHEATPETEEATSGASEAASAEVVERLLAVTVAGQALGTVQTRLEKAPDGTWTNHELVTISLTREGGGPDATFNSTSESTSVYDPAHELVSELEVEREAGVTITRTITFEGDELVSTYSGPGRPEQSKRFALPDDYRSSLAVDFELAAEYERTGSPATRRFSSFDDERERFEPLEVTLTGATQFTHGEQTIPAYVFETKEEDGTIVTTIVDHDFMPLKLDAAGTFVAIWVDEAPTLGAGGGRINSELPVGGRTAGAWWELAEQQVSVSVEGDDASAPPLWDDSHYHEVERAGEDYELKLLSTRPAPGFRAPKLPLRVDDPAVKRYLEPTAMAQSDNALIIAEARKVVGGETDSLRAAAKIVEHVFEDIDKEAGVRGSATASEVLQNGAGDCTEHAVLVVALMRAAGIPARAVDGIVLVANPDGSGMAGYHAWAEIWLGEWIGVDATVNETGTSARYLQFGIDEPGAMSSGGKMMRSIGRTKIQLGPHKTYEELR